MPYTSKMKADRLSLGRGLFFSLMLLAVLLLTLSGCGKDGVLTTIDKPAVFITSYEGVESSDQVSDPYFFQRRIFWRGESPRGIVTGFAYRVLQEDGVTPVNTPKTHIDPNGWIYHYKPGADQSIPLAGDPRSEEVRTIWTKRVFDVIHFPASLTGDSTNVTSVFEIKCKDHYEQESQTARRFFNVVSFKPHVDIIFSDRFRPIVAASDTSNPIYRTIGLGIEVAFEIQENTPYTTPQNTPNYFQFYIEKRHIPANSNSGLGALISRTPEQPGEWLDTREQRNVRRIWLAQTTDNPNDFVDRDDVKFVLTPDTFENGNWERPQTETILYVKAVNMANVHSASRYAKFRVYDNFRPKALIYGRRTNVLSKNHFTTYHHTSIQRILPEAETPEGRHYGSPFFIDKDGKLGTLWSEDIKIYLRWGWMGQYVDEDPDKAFINEVRDINTNRDYLANAKAFDLRLGDAPFPYAPLVNHPDYERRFRFVDPDGTEWLRVPRFYDREIDSRALLTSIPPDDYTLQVRVVDSQNRTSDVTTFDFKVEPTVPRNQKQGILVIDNETFPRPVDKAYTVDFYEDVLAQLNLPKAEFINRREIKSLYGDLKMHPANVFLSPTDLEPYRLVIWHADNPVASGTDDANFHQEYEPFNIYLRGGGNVLISSGANFRVMKSASESQGFYNPTFQRYFGLEFGDTEVVQNLSATYFGPAAKPYMTGASPAANLPITISALNVEWTHTWLATLQQTQNINGLGPVSFFDEDLFFDEYTKPLYRMKVTENGTDFADLPVAIRRKSATNSTYVFGFPLSFMNKDEVVSMLRVIYNDAVSN